MNHKECATNLVTSLQETASFAASTDLGGIFFPNVQSVQTVYEKLAHIFGLKNPRIEFAHFRTAQENIPIKDIAGFHSKMGTEKLSEARSLKVVIDDMKIFGLHTLLHSSNTTMRKAGFYGLLERQPLYVVFHTPHFEHASERDLKKISEMQKRYILPSGSPAAIVAVENGVEPMALERLRYLPQRLEAYDITTIRLIDICHIMRVLEMQRGTYISKSAYISAWKYMVEYINTHFGDEPTINHWPWGTLYEDSLRSEWIDASMIEDVVQAQANAFPTIENQNTKSIIHYNPLKDTIQTQSLKSSKDSEQTFDIPKEYLRLLPIFNGMVKAGVFHTK